MMLAVEPRSALERTSLETSNTVHIHAATTVVTTNYSRSVFTLSASPSGHASDQHSSSSTAAMQLTDFYYSDVPVNKHYSKPLYFTSPTLCTDLSLVRWSSFHCSWNKMTSCASSSHSHIYSEYVFSSCVNIFFKMNFC